MPVNWRGTEPAILTVWCRLGGNECWTKRRYAPLLTVEINLTRLGGVGANMTYNTYTTLLL